MVADLTFGGQGGREGLERLHELDDRDLGRTVRPDDEAAAAKALHEMLSDDVRRSEWKAAAHRSAETFSWSSVSDRFIQQFDRLLQPTD